MQVAGKLIKILPVQTGTGKNGTWVKQEFIIETQEQYPKKICLVAWGQVASNMDQYMIGELLKVSYNLESKEYNNRWFTEVRAWKVEREGSSSGSTDTKREDKSLSQRDSLAESSDDLPF